jgi:hypothetical protein
MWYILAEIFKQKTMKNLTINCDLINKKIEIIYGFEVDYTPTVKGKNFNNNGTWGKIISNGKVINSVSYNPNLHHNFTSDYEVQLAFMKRQLSVYQSLQPKQIQQIIEG